MPISRVVSGNCRVGNVLTRFRVHRFVAFSIITEHGIQIGKRGNGCRLNPLQARVFGGLVCHSRFDACQYAFDAGNNGGRFSDGASFEIRGFFNLCNETYEQTQFASIQLM